MDDDPRARAVDQAYRDHAVEVYRVAFGILRDRDEAVDATQEAFARAWERWEQYDAQQSLRAWLHGIVVHEALDQLRRRRVRRLAAPALGRVEVARAGRSTADPATAAVDRRLIEQALDTLRPEARAVLVLRHYYGYDYAQIGAFLGTAAGTVGSTLSRAHAALRAILGGAAREVPDQSRRVAGRATPRPAESAAEPPEVLP